MIVKVLFSNYIKHLEKEQVIQFIIDVFISFIFIKQIDHAIRTLGSALGLGIISAGPDRQRWDFVLIYAICY